MRRHERRAEGFVQGGSSEGQALGSMFLGSQQGNSLRLKIFNNSSLVTLTSNISFQNEVELLTMAIMCSAL